MSKISEQKALEAYPNKEGTVYHSFFGVLKFDENAAERRGYQEGYDQAMQDIEEFFYDKFNIHPHDGQVVQYVSDVPLETIDDFVEQFKKYISSEQVSKID